MLFKWPLRNLLYVLALAITLPTSCLLFYNIYIQYKQAEKGASLQAYNLAQIAANNTQIFIDDGQQILKRIAHQIQNQHSAGQHNPSCDPIFSEFDVFNTRFANLSQANSEGYLICSTLPQPKNQFTFVGNSHWFKAVSSTKRLVVASPYKGPISGKMVSVLAYPILKKDGSFAGSLQIPIDLLNFRLLPGMDNLPSFINIAIFDSDGTVVARLREPEKYIGRNLRGIEAVEMLFRMKNGTGKATSSDGTEKFYGFVPIKGTTWYATAAISADEVLQAARSTAIRNLTIGILVLIAVFLLALYIGNSISNPIRKLQKVAYRISSGNYEERADLQGPKEITDVAGQFNSMLDVIAHNNKERDHKEKEIYNLAFYDALTNLPNRRLLLERVEDDLHNAQRNHFIGVIAFINIDRFKDVNDMYGQFTGDQFLKHVAQRFNQYANNTHFVARLDSDTFVLVKSPLCVDGEAKVQMANALCDEVHDIFKEPFLLNDATLESSCCIGLTFFPNASNTTDSLFREADIALHKAKDQGRNQNVIYDDLMLAQINERIRIETELKKAIETDLLSMYVQPQFDASKRVIGAELLLRWSHPDLGPLPPYKFIPIAERSELIFELGHWVFKYACALTNRLQQLGIDVPLSINVSPKQFRHHAFVEQVIHMLGHSGANPKQLIFEVTEGLFIEDVEEMTRKMHQLHNLGIRFSIDDFGTGYSNLAYLKQLPLYELKIDRSFVKDIPHDANDKAIVQTILNMAKSLKLKVVAEGVENELQSAFLLEHHCDALQGYLYSKPINVEDWISGHSVKSQPHSV